MDFVIFTQHRTGSYYLVNTLNRHPDIKCHGEIIHEFTQQNLRNPVDLYLKYLYEHERYNTCNKRKIGFKLLLTQFESYCSLEIKKFFTEKKPKIILLHRINSLAIYSSLLRNKITGIYASSQKSSFGYSLNYAKKLKVMVPIDTIIDDINKIKNGFIRIENIVAGLNLEKYRVEYSDLVCDFNAQNELLEFLGVPLLDVKLSSLEDKKISPYNLKDSILNYNEIKEILFPLYPELFELEFKHTSA